MILSEKYSILEKDPGNSLFVDCVEELMVRAEILQALEVCLKGLSHNPSQHSGRLLLARIFYQMGCLPFAIEQLQIIQRETPNNTALNKLIVKLGGTIKVGEGPKSSTNEKSPEIDTLAEADFDVLDLEALGEDLER